MRVILLDAITAREYGDDGVLGDSIDPPAVRESTDAAK
jgi:hypothetical protein